MTHPTTSLLLSAEDRIRVERVEAFARSGAEGVGPLVDHLVDPSWAVRRSVVAMLANIGEPAVDRLIDILCRQRDVEARLAAVVDTLVATRADVEERVMKLAGEASGAVVCDAVQVLGRRRAHHAVPLLAGLSRSADDNVAVAAIEALGRIGGSETVEPLILAVEARHFFRTFPALDALARTGDGRAVDSLKGLLDDPLYAPEAARALGRTGHESAVAPLASLLLRPTVSLVRTAAVALAELRERNEAQFGERESIRGALSAAVDPNDASARIVAALPGLSPPEVASLARVLGWLADPRSIEQLIDLTLDEAPVGPAASEALRRIGPTATPALLAAIRERDSAARLRLLPIIGYAAGSMDDLLLCLEDPEPEVRVRASEALARLGNTAAVSALFRRIGDRDTRVAHAAASAIQSLGSIETKRLALEQARSPDVRTRRAALRIISYFGYPEGLGVLVGAMADEDEKVREAAIYGIPLLDAPEGTAALLAAARHLDPRTRAAVMRALGQTNRAAPVIEALTQALADGEPWVRYYACQSLGRLGIDAATERVVALMQDASGQVRVAAVEALARLTDPRAEAALSTAARASDPDMRRAALLGLGIARRPTAIGILREAAVTEDAATRLVAIGALAEFDSSDVVPVLAHAASDPDDAVRSAAIGYLSTRPGPDATAALLEQLRGPHMRERAIEALAVAADERVEVVLGALELSDVDTASLYVSVLARMRRPSSHAALAAALAFDNVHARRAAASALVAVGTPEARAALARTAAADPDLDVRRICSAATRS